MRLSLRFTLGGVVFMVVALALGLATRRVAGSLGVGEPWAFLFAVPVVVATLAIPLGLAVRFWVVFPLRRIVEANRAPDGPQLIPENRIPNTEIGDIMRSRNETLTRLREESELAQQRTAQLENLLRGGTRFIALLGRESSSPEQAVRESLDLLRGLVQARYGAALVDFPGRDRLFVYSGVEPEVARRIGSPPSGKGILGLPPETVLCIDDIAAHPRHAGFPPHHPRLKSLLLVPLRGMRTAFGKLFLADRLDGQPFGDQDLTLARAFGRTLGALLEGMYLVEQVRRSEASFRAVLDGASDAIVVADEHLRVLYFSRAAERMFGWTAEEVVGRSVLELVPEPMRKTYLEQGERFLRAGRFDGRLPLEVEAQRRDGERIPVEVTVAPVEAENAPHQLVAIIRDISARKEEERAQADFLAMLTHDIKNPLNVILGYADILRESIWEKLDAEQRMMLDATRDSAERILHLVQNFLVASRIDAGRLECSPERVDLGAFVRSVCERYAGGARPKGIEIAVTAADSCHAEIDCQQMERVLANLLSNAVKHSPRGSTVEVSLRCAGHIARLCVSDRGPGIPPEARAGLFQRYGTVGIEHDPAGTGLGLYIVKTIVEEHGGRVAVEDRPGGGTTFSVELPLAA